MKIFSEEELKKIWFRIGSANRFIRRADNPPFQLECFCKCATIEALKTYLSKGNWCLGQAFYYENLCFINQSHGGDVWLTIKDDYFFESIVFARVIKKGEFEALIGRLLAATKEQCLSFDY